MSSSPTVVSSSAGTQKEMFRQLEYFEDTAPETEEKRQTLEQFEDGICIWWTGVDGWIISWSCL